MWDDIFERVERRDSKGYISCTPIASKMLSKWIQSG